jgi:choline dehydrogenase-like flavoprotein
LYITLKLILRENSGTLSFHRSGEPFRLRDHLSNVLGNLPEIFKTFPQLMTQYLSRDDLRPLFIRNARGKYALHYHSEQIPSYSSRVRLIDNRGSGVAVSVDFRFSEDDARSVVRAHHVLDEALRRSGKGYIEYWQVPEQRIPSVMAQAIDGYHQIGTTRMSESDRLGVVDRDCRVHGLNNLYVAGSSVFNTSGQANPTFFAVALAARLAEHLHKRSASSSVIAGKSPRPI